jgi:hypothetical protein
MAEQQHQPPRGADIGLAAAAHLEIGLEALERGNVPAAVGALAAIDAEAWAAICARFPVLPYYVAREVIR